MESNDSSPRYRVRRRAPYALVSIYPQLWPRMAPVRFAWLQLPWLFAGCVPVLLLCGDWTAVAGYIALWLWQRRSPSLWLCQLVERGLFFAFAVMLLQAHVIITSVAVSPFAVIAVFGILPLLYEASGRSWHALFNDMADDDDGFRREALNRGWLVETAEKMQRPQRFLPVAVTVAALAITSAVIAHGVAIGYLLPPVGM